MKAVTIGSAMIDVITIVDPERIERMTLVNEHKSYLWLETGRKIPARSITTHVGGGACNTAVSMARRGWDVAALTKIGHDLNAQAVREHLGKEGVSLERLQETDAAATGVSSLIASHDRNATIFVHRGANELLAPEDAEQGFEGVDVVHICPLSNRSADAFPIFAERAKADGAFISANPGIRQLTARGRIVLEALKHVDLLSVNRVEAEALVPIFAHDAPPPGPIPPDAPDLLRTGLHFGGFDMCLTDFAKAIHAAGPRWLLITDGGQGAYLAGPDGLMWRAPAPADVLGTAGAGDAFTSTLVAALAEGAAPDEALAQASVNAASVIGAVDTTTGLLDRKTLTERAAQLPDEDSFRLYR
jgi:sugar/nucleoside kinase (ribokinase family)